MFPYETIALCELPLVAQRILAHRGESPVRQALAASTLTSIEVVDVLARDTDPRVRRFALSRTSDIEALASALTPGREGLIAASAARNPLAPVELLVEGLRSEDRRVALGCMTNPSTPLEERKRLTPIQATLLILSMNSMADTVARSHELVLANDWVTENPLLWDGPIRRAIAASPAVDLEGLGIIKKAGAHGRKTVRQHPLMRRPSLTTADLVAMPAAQVADLGSPVSDLIALTDRTAAERILARQEPEPEPHIIGRIVNAHGPAILASLGCDITKAWAGTRIHGATLVAPVLAFVPFGLAACLPELNAAAAELGNDANAWEAFLALLPSWHEEPLEAVLAAKSL